MSRWSRGLQAHHERGDMTGEHALGDAGQLLLLCLFALVWLADTLLLRWTVFLNGHVSLVIRVAAGLAVLLSAVYLSRRSLSIVFGEERDPPEVIREGPFGLVRHPVYLSEILLYLGALLLSLSLAAAAVWVAGIVFFHTIARYEERLLLARFGQDYERYMREVPMWIPRLRR